MQLRQITLFAVLICTYAVAEAETLELRNGDRLTGSVVRIESDALILRSQILGEVTIPITAIAAVDGANISVEERPAAPRQVARPECDQDSGFEGEVDFGFEKDAGTSDSEEIDLRLKTSYQRGLIVGSLSLEHESEAQRDRSTSEEYEIEITAERFARTVGNGRYWYVRSAWNKNRFRTPEAWTTLGTGIGYALKTGKRTRIKLQGGIDGWAISGLAGQDTATGGRVVLEMRRSVSSLSNVTLFSEAQFLWEFANPQNRVLETSSGVRIPLSDQFYAQVSLDYDRFDFDDVPDSAENDETEWNFRFGLEWD